MQRKIGEYQLTQQLGYGALGKTFLAEHHYLKRPFILKFLPPELAEDADFIARFEKRIAFLSGVEHEHIAKIHDVLHLEGEYVVVSEPVLGGKSLLETFLSEEGLLQVARQLACSLDDLHGREIAHGAIKFNNVIVKEQEGQLVAMWTDAGLSAVLPQAQVLSRMYHYVAEQLKEENGLTCATDSYHPDVAEVSTLQRSFCENFYFLAPEQHQTLEPVDEKLSDRYAFGVLMYYLLTKTFPLGRFPLPCEKNAKLTYNWDVWISSLLHPEPALRPASLLESLEEEVMVNSQVSDREKLKELRSMEKKEVPSLVGTCAKMGSLSPVIRPQEIKRPAFDADPGAIFHIDTAVSTYKPYKETRGDVLEPIETQMIIVPEGTCTRGGAHGARDEMPKHKVFLDVFALEVHPVTNEQFVRFLEVQGGEKDVQNNDIIRLRDSRIKRIGGSLSIESGYAKHPVVGVTWYGAQTYAKWVGKRLPTEAEWEIAAFGGKESAFYPNAEEMDRSYANFFSSDTTAVMSYPPNPYGLYDMAGNVYEWCEDWYDYHYYDVSSQEPSNPKGPAQGVYRVLRGGCWKSSKEDLRCAHRHRNNPGAMNGTYGFRCAADVAPNS